MSRIYRSYPLAERLTARVITIVLAVYAVALVSETAGLIVL